MKLCKTCGIEKPTTEFHKDKSKTDGLNLYCKPCQIDRQKRYAMQPPRNPAPDGMKRCQTCKETKPLADFYNRATTYDGLAKVCKICSGANQDRWRRKNLPIARQYSKKWREENPRLSKDHKLKSTYGIPLGTYDRLLETQQGKCAICGTENPGGKGDFHVDHCHDTQAIRGLLCHNCNVGIGHFNHNPDIILAAVNYLELSPKGS